TGSLTATVVATGILTATLAGRVDIDTAAGVTAIAVAARNLSLDLGDGLTVSAATVGLYVRAGADGSDVALDATGTVSLAGWSGVSLGGAFRARINGFGAGVAVSESIVLADGSGDVAVVFAAGEAGSFSGTGVTLTVLGQSMTADLVFASTDEGYTVTVSDLTLSFADGGVPVASFSGGSGILTMETGSGEVSAVLGGELAITVPGFSYTGSLDLELSTGAADSHVRVTGAAITLTVAGQAIAFDDVTISRTTVAGATRTDITLAGGEFAIAGGLTDLLTLSDIAGALTITAGGVAGRLSAAVASDITGFTFATTVALAVNTGAAAVGDLPAGPYLRIEAVGTTITVGGQALTADLTFERGVDADGETVVRAGMTNGSLVFSASSVEVLSVTNGTGALLLTSDGIAASLSGVITVAIPEVSFTGTLGVRLNTTGVAVDTTVAVAGADIPLVLPAGADYLQLTGADVVLVIAGQRLTGTITVENAAGTTTVSVAGGSLEFGDGIATLSGVTAELRLGGGGIWGTFEGVPTLAVPGVSVTAATLTVQLNTRTDDEDGLAAGTIRVGAEGMTIAVAGVEITGDVWFERVVTGDVVAYRIDVSGGTAALEASGTTYVAVSGLTGTFLITPAGVAGSVSAIADVDVPDLLELDDVAVTVSFNTTPGPADVGGGLILPAGPYLRVELADVDARITGVGRLVGDFAFIRSADAAGDIEITLAMTDVDAYVGNAGTPSLFDGTGVLLVRADGVAGFVSGSASLGGSGVSATGSVLLQVNTTPAAIDTTLSVAGTDIVFTLPAPPSGQMIFSLSVSNLTLTIGDFVTIEGDLTYSDTVIDGLPVRVVAATGLTIFLGRGPAFLASGALNPLAVGVLLTGASIGLIEMGNGHALVATGTVSLIGVAGVTLIGTTMVRVNSTGQAIDQTIEIPGSTLPGVAVKFATAAAVTEFIVSDATLAFGGQSLSGTFAFGRTATDLTVAVTDGAVAFGDAVQLGTITGDMVIRAGGIAGTLSATVTIAALGVDGVAAAVAVNSAPAAVTVGTATLPGGPYVRVALTGLALAFLGQSLRADIAVERLTSGGTPITVVGLANVGLFLGDDKTTADVADDIGVRLSNGSGILVLAAAGLAGRIEGTIAVNLPAGAQLRGSLALVLNTTAARVAASVLVGTTTQALDVAAGPYLRFEGAGLTLTVLDQSLTADVAIERVTALSESGLPDGGRTVLRIAATSVQLSLGGGVLTLTDGAALILLTTGTSPALAGRITGAVALDVPGVAFSGNIAVEFNTAAEGIDESFTVNGQTLVLVLPPGGADGYIRLAGDAVVLTVAGQSLVTDLEVTDADGTLTLTLRNTRLALGGSNPLVTLAQPSSGAGATSTIVLVGASATAGAAAGAYGAIAVGVSIALPDVSVTGTITVAFNTTGEAKTVDGWTVPLPSGLVRVGGEDLSISVLGQTLTGDVTFEQVRTTAGGTVVRLGLAHVSMALGPLTASEGTGLFVITSAGVAGSIAVEIAVAAGAFELVGALELQVNTTGAAVTETLRVGAGSVTLEVPAGPYLRVAGTGIVLTVLGQSVTADIAVERVTSYGADGVAGGIDDSTLTRIALTRARFTFAAGAARLTLTDGEAVFVLPGTGAGMAGRLSGTIALSGVPGVSLAGALALEINSTAGAVDETVRVGTGTVTVTLPSGGAGGYLRIAGTGVAITVAGQTLAGDVEIVKSGADLTLTLANGVIALGASASPVVSVTGIAGTFRLNAAGMAGSVSAVLSVNVPVLTVSGAVSVQINSGATAVTLDDGGPGEVELQPGLRIEVADATITIAGQALGADRVLISRTPAGEVAFAVTDMTLQLGTFVNITTAHAWSGAMLITPQGVAASFSGSTTGIFTLPGLTLGGDVEFAVNTSTAAVRRTDLGIDVPAGAFLHVAITDGVLAVTGGPSFSGNFLLSRTTTTGATPTSVTIIAFSQVTVSLTPQGEASPVGITDGVGAFLLTAAGIAGTFSGAVAVAGGGVNADATISVRYNGTAAAVNQTIAVGGVAVPLVFSETEKATGGTAFVAVSVSGAITLGDFVEIIGTVSFGAAEVTVTGLTVFVGQGPGFVEGGARNPFAKGLYLTDVNGSVKGTAGSRVVAISGTVELVGIPGVTLAGTAWVFFNETTSEQVLGTGDDAVTVAEGTAAAPHVLVIGDLVLGVAGQELTGTFAIETLAGGGLRLKFGSSARDGGNPLTLSLGDGVAVASVASGELELTPAGLATVLTATLALNAGDAFTLTGEIRLQVNTSTTARTVLGVLLPAGSVRVQVGTLATPAVLTIDDQALSGVFVFSQVRGPVAAGAPAGTTAPSTTVLIASALSLSLGTATAGVRLTDGQAVFVMTAAGIAGRVGGSVRFLIPGDAVQFSGTFTVAVNSGAAVNQTFELDGTTVALALPAGPYLRVDGTGVAIVVAGQRLSGDFSFTQSGSGATASTVIAIANARAAFGDGATDFIALTDGTGSFTLDSTGVAGRVDGTVAVTLPGVAVSGAFAVTLSPASSSIEVVGTDITLDIGGFLLTDGDLTFSQRTVGGVKIVDVAIAAKADFGAPIGILNLTGALQIGSGGLAGVLEITEANISLGGTFSVSAASLRFEINRSAQAVVLSDVAGTRLEAGPYIRIVGEGIVLDLGDISLTASVSFQQATNAAGVKRTVIAIAGGEVALGTDAPLLTGVDGLIVLTPAGMAMSLAGTLDLGALLPDGVTIAGSFFLMMNNTNAQVTESVTVGGRSVSLALAAGPYVRVGGTGITLSIAGQSLGGDISFERSGATTTIVLANVGLRIGGGGADILTLTGGAGKLVIETGGMSGTISGTVALTVPGVSASATMVLGIDTRPATQKFAITATDLSLDISGQRLSGDFTFEQSGTGAARVVKVAATDVRLFLGDAKNPDVDTDDVGLLLTNGNGAFL
ncbi:MAG TPA: hypothetical protein VFY91_14380, partial [Microbacterium sp.]|nr:hypothetical protein [Microbacterium sp.]